MIVKGIVGRWRTIPYRKLHVINQWRIQDLQKEGSGPWRTRAAPSRGQWTKPPWSWKVFLSFNTKKWPEVQDLNKNLPPPVPETDFFALPQPALSFGQWGVGGGGRPGPPITGSVTGINNVQVFPVAHVADWNEPSTCCRAETSASMSVCHSRYVSQQVRLRWRF